MSMFSETAIEVTVKALVAIIEEELKNNKDKPDACAALKKIGKFALTQFEYSIPDWARKYQELFKEQAPQGS